MGWFERKAKGLRLLLLPTEDAYNTYKTKVRLGKITVAVGPS
jgi:hypothetical protein